MRKKPGAIKEATDTDSVMLHSIYGDEPPPLFKVWGVIDWQNEQRGIKTIKKDRKDLKFMGLYPFYKWGIQNSKNEIYRLSVL